jgi:LETM1-like protein
VDGTKEMWSNHGRCKAIRAKQKEYRDKLQKQWEYEEQQDAAAPLLSPQQVKERLRNVNGGITYDEFVFLIQGREDRGKLMNMVFLMWGAPRFFPYALMFYPDILPGPFAPPKNQQLYQKETKLQKLSRERSHAVLRTLLAIETEARAVPALAKLNIFGKKAQAQRLDDMDSLGKTIGQIMSMTTTTTTTTNTKQDNNNVGGSGGGGSVVLNTLEHYLYKKGGEEDFSRAEKRLVKVPKCITTGLLHAISGCPNVFQAFMPHFLKRGQVLNHLQKLAEIDNFLVHEKVDLTELSTARLVEACADRMILAGPGRSDQELRADLQDWLDLAVHKPTRRIRQTGEYFNENLARTALLSYFGVCGAQDARSSSYLPRLLYQGRQLRQQQQQQQQDSGGTTTSSNKKNRK